MTATGSAQAAAVTGAEPARPKTVACTDATVNGEVWADSGTASTLSSGS